MSSSEPVEKIWKHQEEGLRQARCEDAQPMGATETLFGHLRDRTVHWSDNPAVEEPCVAVLRHYANEGRPPVLILPGATAWRGTFLQPDGGLIARLQGGKRPRSDGYDVWTLDWRGTKVITDLWRGRLQRDVPEAITRMRLADIASEEVPAAVAHIAQHSSSGAGLAILGHCIGSAVAALAIARGDLREPLKNAPSRPKAILSTIGLFYRGAVDTWLRANERLDESPGTDQRPEPWYIDFEVDLAERPAWPDLYESFYSVWTKTPYPHCELSFCRRISSIIGAPYRPDDIAYLHDDERNGLAAQFGVLPLELLDDIGRAVRRGYADANLVANGGQAAARERFVEFDVTLLTGSENQLWHRDSIDRMHEWLLRSRAVPVEKRIFDRFGHQDLWWSPRAAERDGVYDYVERRLRGEPGR